MLIKCPECELQVSDKAAFCPHCGYPFQNKTKNPTRGKSRLRLPNGFGQITKISSKPLRNPWRVMVHIGTNPVTGRPKQSLLKPKAYFATYNEAYQALVEYNRNPYDLEDQISFAELYSRWSAEYFKTLKSSSSIRTIEASYRYCSQIYNTPVKALRSRHLKGCIEESGASPVTKSKMKSMMNLMFDYALEYEITDRNYARDFKLSNNLKEAVEENKKEHIAFSDKELRILWAHTDLRTVRMILVQTYMGWRPQELCKLEEKNINGGFACGGSKTKAGTNRRVPIHHLIKDFMVSEGKYLFENETYMSYRKAFMQTMEVLDLRDHRAHDPRKTFVTLAKRYGMDEYAVKRFVGHTIDDITEKIYTERTDEWLISEIEKIKGPTE